MKKDKEIDSAALKRLRAICLSLPETTEVNSWGHPNFRAGKKTFVTYEWLKNQATIAFRIAPLEIDMFLLEKQFSPTPYGRGQWVSLIVNDKLDWQLVRDMVQQSYRLVALKRMILVLDKTLNSA